MKARQAKAGLNPGPGAYDVKRPIVTASEVRRPAPLRNVMGAGRTCSSERPACGGSAYGGEWEETAEAAIHAADAERRP